MAPSGILVKGLRPQEEAELNRRAGRARMSRNGYLLRLIRKDIGVLAATVPTITERYAIEFGTDEALVRDLERKYGRKVVAEIRCAAQAGESR
jgi:hypothetical protein